MALKDGIHGRFPSKKILALRLATELVLITCLNIPLFRIFVLKGKYPKKKN